MLSSFNRRKKITLLRLGKELEERLIHKNILNKYRDAKYSQNSRSNKMLQLIINDAISFPKIMQKLQLK